MPYRRSGNALEVTTSEGVLRVAIEPDALELHVADRSVRIAGGRARVRVGAHEEQHAITRRLIVTRHVPREDLALWLEGECGGMRRIFGVAPPSILAREHAASARTLNEAAAAIRSAMRGHAGTVVHSAELGDGRARDRLLVVEDADRHVLFASRLFRRHARPVMTMHRDGRIAFDYTDEILVDERLAIDVCGEGVRLTQGARHARVALPSIAPEVLADLARRLRTIVART